MRDSDTPLTVSVDGKEKELTQMTCKDFYRTQLPRDTAPACRRKWASEHFYFSVAKWKEICRLPYEVSTSTKLQALQYRVMNRYVPTRKFLFDRKVVQSQQCLYCSQTDNICHFLYSCSSTLAFWEDIIEETNRKIGTELRLNNELVIFGQKRAGKLPNYIILIAKQYVMNRKLHGEPLSSNGLWAMVHKQYEVEKCIANQPGGNLKRFRKKWRRMNPDI